MSLCLLEGFEDGLSRRRWAYLRGGDNGINSDATKTRTPGGLAGLVAGGNPVKNAARLNPEDEHATLIVGLGRLFDSAFYDNVRPGAGYFGNILSLLSDDGATTHVTVQFADADNIIEVRRGDSAGTVLGTSAAITPAPAANEWNYIEVKAVLHDTAGSVVVKFNGTTILNLTGIDTKNAGTKAVFDSIGISPNGYAQSQFWIDDVYVCNGAGSSFNDFLGTSVAVRAVRPAGNGSQSQLVGSDGNSTDNYLLVDDAEPVSMTDYVGSGTAGQQDLYAMSDLSVSGSVLAVTASTMAVADVGTATSKVALRHGGTTSVSPGRSVGTTAIVHDKAWEAPPDGGSWTLTKVNALEAGAEVG